MPRAAGGGRTLRRGHWSAWLALLVCLGASSASGQAFRDGIADAWLEEAAPALNHGNDAQLVLRSQAGDNERAVLKFDLTGVPANANVTEAELWLWVTDADTSGAPVNVYRVTEDWNEGSVTWGNAGTDYDASTVHGSFVATKDAWAKVNILPLAQAWICGEFQDFGIMLVPTSAGLDSTYASREWNKPGLRPRIKFSTAGTNPCADGVDHFLVEHDSFGIHCSAESVTVRVVDAAGNPVTGYQEEVTLDTQSGRGTWTLVTGGGTLSDATPNDGIATYQWAAGDSEAVFTLSYSEGADVLDIDAYQSDDPTLRDDDTEGVLTFSASGFTVTGTGLGNPPPAVIAPFTATQTAAVGFPVHIAAYGQTPEDPLCGVIESYAGDRTIKFWSQYLDPGSGALPVSIDGQSIAGNEAGAVAQTVTFTSGQAVVTARYDDAGLMQILLKDDTTTNAELPAGIRGATAGFVVQPADFVLSDIADAGGAVINPQAADAAGPVFLAAGAPFRVTVTAVDAEGDATPNYGQETVPESVRLDVNLLAPLGGSEPPVTATVGFGPFAGGSATGFDFAWGEVGIIALVPAVADGDYLGSGDVLGAPSERVGRFIPDHFDAATNVPVLQTACAAGGFTYLGQPFAYLVAPVMTLTAQAVGDTPTVNYTGAFFKLDTAFLENRLYQATTGTLDPSGLPPPSVDPAVIETAPGVGTATFSGGTGLAFSRVTPTAPFDAEIDLSIDVFDGDGVAASGNSILFGDIAFSAGAALRYGRIALGNAVGSERVDLPVPMTSEYFAGSGIGFVSHADDACADTISLAFSGYTENLSPGETCVLDAGSPGDSGMGCAAPAPPALRYREPPAVGDFNLMLKAPGAGNNGSLTIEATVPDWLTFDWNGALPGEEHPEGQATFGIFQGSAQQIYLREVY